MTDWKNIGDIRPESGTLLIRGGEIDRNGDFSIEMVEVIPETAVGGDDSRFLLRSGTGFLAAKNFAGALETIGASIDPGSLAITRPGHHGDTIVEQAGTGDWIRTMAHAAHAYGGIDDVDISTLVQIGRDQPCSQDRKFTGDIDIFASNSNLWAIMRKELDGFDYDDGSRGGARFLETIEEETSPQPW